MNGPETPAIDNTVKRIQRGIEIQSRKDFHIEHFEIRSKTKSRVSD
jgi:Uri superfamily endonuclease